jgi:serine/threonine-protein kinase RsbW|tara:strand:- start:250 stop:660 length:411 start_codon:yes stop_codon:yes gene_type:complete
MTNQVEKISFQSTPENLIIVEEFIENTCTNYNVGPDVFGNIMVAVTEAVNNAIYHGNLSLQEKQVQVRSIFEAKQKRLSFVITDEGAGFEYNNLPDPTAPENITMIGGRGVFLIKQLADWVIFNDPGNSVELQFKL